ncbi:glycosyltransferase family 2 protein [Hydrogenophaga sp. PAMC20947]|nr:glycosyltransferase family 2 protein [Hydrogenophaga sp. PAMC20947]
MRIAVVIPSYKVKTHVLDVIHQIGPEVEKIYVIDDACPEESGNWVHQNCTDQRVKVLYNAVNLGVGGAVKTGYFAALLDEMEIIIKIDGDGQMQPKLIPLFIQPIIEKQADYTKGNRFFNLEQIGRMPKLRIFGNAALSFLSKFSSGYWDIFDPTNGYTAIHARLVEQLPMEKISNRYFFESDMLFRLNLLQAKVLDIPMDSRYEGETSNLKVSQIVGEFISKHSKNFLKRIFYNYFLRDFSVASVELVAGIALLFFGGIFGAAHWVSSMNNAIPSSPGTVMLAGMSVLVGIQFLLSFLSFDIQNKQQSSVWPRLQNKQDKKITVQNNPK